MRRTHILVAAMPLLAACSAAQLQSLDQTLASASASAASGTTPSADLTEAAAKAQGIRTGQIVGGTLSTPSEVDEFTFEGRANQELVLFAGAPRQRADEGEQSGSGLYVQLYSPTGGLVSLVGVTKGQSLENNYSQTIQLPSTDMYTMRVNGTSPATRGPYQFVLREVNRDPEAVPKRIAVGQLISGEAIDSPGDVDQFTFEGRAGQELVLFAGAPRQRADEGLDPYDSGLNVQLLAPTGGLVSVVSVTKGQSLENNYSQTIQLPSTDTYTVQVSGKHNVARGPYQFVLRPRQ